jgi:hypothetical protein
MCLNTALASCVAMRQNTRMNGRVFLASIVALLILATSATAAFVAYPFSSFTSMASLFNAAYGTTPLDSSANSLMSEQYAISATQLPSLISISSAASTLGAGTQTASAPQIDNKDSTSSTVTDSPFEGFTIEDKSATKPGNPAVQASVAANQYDLSNNAGISDDPRIATAASNLYVSWTDDTAGNQETYIKRSSNYGVTFAGTASLSANSGSSTDSQIAATGANVYAAWVDDTPNLATDGNTDILYRRSVNSGATYGAATNLSPTAGFSINPKIAASGSNVYVVWQEDSATGGISFKRSIDSGAVFGGVNILSATGTSPQIATGGNNNVYIVWEDGGDIRFKKSVNGGDTFGAAINLSNNAGESTLAKVTSSGTTNVYVVWSDDTTGNNDILFKKSTDKGTSFSSKINLSSNAGDSTNPRIAASGNSVYIVWQDTQNGFGGYDTFFRKSSNKGASFASGLDLSANSGDSVNSQVMAYGSNVYVSWEDNASGEDDIMFKRSTNGGLLFGTTLTLSDTASGASNVVMAASGTTIYAAWHDDDLGAGDIYLKRSTTNATDFAEQLNLSSNAGYSQAPQVAVSGSNVYVVWYDLSGANSDIFFSRSTNYGASFGSTVNLSSNAAESGNPKLAVSGSNVYVVWHDNTPGNYDTFFKRSTDAGATFGSTVNLSTNPGSSNYPQLAVLGSNVYIVWEDHTPGNSDIFIATSTNNGASFALPVNLSNNADSSFGGQIAVSGSNVYVSWHDFTPGNNDIFLRRSTDDGATFGASVNLSNNAGNSIDPQLSVLGSNVYVVWQDRTPGNDDIFFRRSTDDGATFSASVNLSNNAGFSNSPQIAVSGINVYVAWYDFTPGNFDIFYRRSADAGSIFSASVNLSNNPEDSYVPQLAVSGSNVYVVWRGVDVFLKISINSGTTFGSTMNVSSNTGTSTLPQIAIAGNLHLVWQDETPGTPDIFYSRGT